jgi:succinate dehydrogenase/fumarate reductase flavoprotein subunit
LQKAVWDLLGPLRNEKGILLAQEKIRDTEERALLINSPIEMLLALEMRGLTDTASAVADGAILRKHSLGTHFREEN